MAQEPTTQFPSHCVATGLTYNCLLEKFRGQGGHTEFDNKYDRQRKEHFLSKFKANFESKSV